ncbi:nitronate monooxygenase [Rhodococcus sp. T2V]|uniref:NAD(P)H-dependent flavin oxidoreductase n=1 Tax=Rhodococcus sp. T2V TaxID=3034164 RepID=UPI0023E31213|nr:nitronate monooxygenase [Rhodococcus sp. T2V]MDF3311895.1 nitronate monooxygenase [Rhodococcus sp. T2V]
MIQRLPPRITSRLRLPVIAAPMLRVSGPELVVAAAKAGVIGAFPTANARSADELDQWLGAIDSAVDANYAPYAPNLIMRSPRFAQDLDVILRHNVEIVIISVGSPAAAVGPLHERGVLVFADVATLRHARLAIDAGADGLILLTAGAGGQTGWVNPFAFARAVRAIFDGPVVLAGGVSDGYALRATQVLQCDLAYMGTAFIATEESRAEAEYKTILVDSDIDDIVLTRAFTGLPANMLIPSIRKAGLDPADLDEHVSAQEANQKFGRDGVVAHRWSDIWSAGHSTTGVRAVVSVSALVQRLADEYNRAGVSGQLNTVV